MRLFYYLLVLTAERCMLVIHNQEQVPLFHKLLIRTCAYNVSFISSVHV